MKTGHRIFAGAFCLLISFSCAKEKEPEGGETILVATCEDGESRTYRSGDNKTLWQSGDQIKVYSSSSSANFTLIDGAGTKTGRFSGITQSSPLYAVYPSGITSSRSGTTVNVTIPATQTGTFGAGNIATAKVDGNGNMSFTNANAFLCIATSAAIHHIVVTSVNGAALAGTIPVSYSSGSASWGAATSTASSIRLNTNKTAGTYYIAIVPNVTHSEGLTIAYYTAESTLSNTYYLRKSIVATRNGCIEFGSFEPDGKNYYVTTSGAGDGNGISWSNAMSAAKFKTLVTPDADASKQAAKIAAINGATFHLGAGNYNFGADPTINFSSLVTLTIKGGYPAAGGTQDLTKASQRANFTGDSSHEALKLKGKLNITFEGVGFINGSISYNADHTDGTSQGAGSLDIMGNATNDMTVTMSNCLVDGNVNASYAGESEYWGAGVFLHCGRLNATNVTFSNNQSHFAPALVTWKGGSYATLTSCTFSSNAAASNGGAVILAFGSNATFNTSTFSSNTSGANGGAMLTQGSAYFTCTGCNFTGNTATGSGGAVFTSGTSANASCTNCTFSGNSANRGGAALVEGSTTTTFTTSTFTGNTATDQGGAIRATDSAVLYVYGCTFGGSSSGTYNYTTDKGGAIYSTSNATVNIGKSGSTRTVFEGNYVTTGKGGAVRHQSSYPLTCNGVTFKGNHSDATEGDMYGGALCIDNGFAVVSIADCIFDSNYCNIYGGSALSYQDGGDTGGLTVTGSVFKDNYSNFTSTGANTDADYGQYGGAIRLSNSGNECNFNNCEFYRNHPNSKTYEQKGTWGGAIICAGSKLLKLNGCYFEGNYATRGGAISAYQCSANGGVYMNACSFKGNYASFRVGTTICFEQSVKFCMNNCSFYDDTYAATPGNVADAHDWVYLQGGADAKAIKECVISNCSLIARDTSTGATYGKDHDMIYILNINTSSTYKAYLINNILIAGGSKYDWWINAAPLMSYNNVDLRYGNNGNTSYTATGDTKGKTAGSFSGLAWNDTNHIWTWTSLSGGYTAITKTNFESYIGTASADFKTWLTSISALDKDQLGTSRGSGSWNPGAYKLP